MKRRPEHATDCPGCDIGWVTGELLCPRCAEKVQAARPTFYTTWLHARAAMVAAPQDTVATAMEAYHRGLIVGTAMALKSPPPRQRPKLGIPHHAQGPSNPQ